MEREAMKAAAAAAAVDEVQSGMVLGLGTGSTADHAIRDVAARLEDGRIDNIVAVATSLATAALAQELGIELIGPGQLAIDLAIDGADEIAPDLALTKGGGGALLREKIIAASATRFLVIADDSKLVAAIGTSFDIPLEIAKFGLEITRRALEEYGDPELRGGDEPFETDNGNFIFDLAVAPVPNPAWLDERLHSIPGVLATGIFVDIADVAYVADPSGVRRMEPVYPVTKEVE